MLRRKVTEQERELEEARRIISDLRKRNTELNSI